MADHPIEGLMGTTLEKIKQMVDVNSIIGDPITSPDGTIIVPISKVSYGFASGGSDFAAKSMPEKQFFGGGTGAGVSISPVAFLTISNGEVKLLRVDPGSTSVDRVIEQAPEMIDKVAGFFGKGKKQKQQPENAAAPKTSEGTENNS